MFVFNELSSSVLIFLTDKKQLAFYASDGFGTRSLKVVAYQERHASIDPS